MRQHNLNLPDTLTLSQDEWVPDSASSSQQLKSGRKVLLSSSYKRGLHILSELKSEFPISPNSSYSMRMRLEQQFRQMSLNLIVGIEDSAIQIIGIDQNPFLKDFFPQKRFFLPFVVLQELAGAWKRFSTGIHYAVLGRKLHPFFGVYYPTRTEHLELFATWLSQYNGSKDHCVDVGTGSGILSFLLAKSGFRIIDAIDQNPNAIWSVQEELKRHPIDQTIRLHHADLLSPIRDTNLIVFNPPWIPGKSNSSVTEALFFDGELFERFFEQAYTKLSDDGTIVLIFSTILTLLRPDIPHPIESELQKGRFKLKQKLQRKVKPTAGKRTKEKVQIWELTRI